jgi:fatty acid desaturase
MMHVKTHHVSRFASKKSRLSHLISKYLFFCLYYLHQTKKNATAGEDLYTFDDAVKPNTGSFYVRQIIGSTNYAMGTDIIDFAHGFLNYQIEHHVWPDLSMLQYQIGAPKLKLLCKKYGVPYVQENVFERLRKTVDIMIGRTTMRKFPIEYEPSRDKTVKVTWSSTNGAIDE